ncbi:FAD-containing monooxygenase EthA [Flexivirga endophytica]|uniref:FAD-containing monooxygenase EthA n=1 Tax=Flexivirga endophytica TaxID=1849103 RepID=A0A916WR10_9MICO|nr:NAD(P)/FAD-dependent oxidoreductase [Flexivirga endophytica]GGB24514.1 FAD-containing monooxygenase EthA [Flexivirga endophytica]GHB63210.1 FAD-containing monooxygenase EthA [Flexivirga endophytica]
MPLQDHYDVLVVGAGLSGIDAGYRIQTMCPGADYAILEARETLGGTWDLFRYPGIRSDSDMFTLGFPFEPWTGEKSIADGADILQYLKDTAAKYGIDRRIVYSTKVTEADWSSTDARWTLTVTTPEGTFTVTADFVYLCSGYYNYDQGYRPDFAGIDDFAGDVIHPQFWPDDLDVDGKKISVIGSGATAMTLVPALTRQGATVTMIQRSPTYVISLPSRDVIANTLRKVLPGKQAYAATRMKNAVTTVGFYEFCRRAPGLATKVLRTGVARQIKDSNVDMAAFTPRYKPWDERLCVVPDSDLFKAIRHHDVEVVTDTIDHIEADGIHTGSGRSIPSDIIVTATGLNVQLAGGATLRVDGKECDPGGRYIYQGLMLEGVPNAAVCIGYTNASWTLRADLSAKFFCRFINHVRAKGHAYGYPTVTSEMPTSPALDLAAGYIQRSIATLPKQGDRKPWFLRQNYFADRRDARRANVTDDMTFVRPGEARTPNDDLHTAAAEPSVA